MSMRLLGTVEDVEPYMDRFRDVFHSWHCDPAAGHRWANVFPVVEQLLEGPTFQSARCPAARTVESALTAELASRHTAVAAPIA